jgi:hypothetical protein
MQRKIGCIKLRYIKKRTDEAEKFSDFFLRHGAILVFVSKFVYGTRIAGQILPECIGSIFEISFATTLGSMIWFGIFYILLRTADLRDRICKSVDQAYSAYVPHGGWISYRINIFTGTVCPEKNYEIRLI